jgi:hypothetical protein
VIRSNRAKLLELLQKLAANWSRALYNDFYFGIAETLCTGGWQHGYGSSISVA